eukprot:GHVQ01028108.1.p1 GENE.GHVQ01028108.1~~GHVQ01028108.1.p1  ORF type:complete len:554 (-),score=77.15 GHVQ01028108.1:482-2143(-)
MSSLSHAQPKCPTPPTEGLPAGPPCDVLRYDRAAHRVTGAASLCEMQNEAQQNARVSACVDHLQTLSSCAEKRQWLTTRMGIARDSFDKSEFVECLQLCVEGFLALDGFDDNIRNYNVDKEHNTGISTDAFGSDNETRQRHASRDRGSVQVEGLTLMAVTSGKLGQWNRAMSLCDVGLKICKDGGCGELWRSVALRYIRASVGYHRGFDSVKGGGEDAPGYKRIDGTDSQRGANDELRKLNCGVGRKGVKEVGVKVADVTDVTVARFVDIRRECLSVIPKLLLTKQSNSTSKIDECQGTFKEADSRDGAPESTVDKSHVANTPLSQQAEVINETKFDRDIKFINRLCAACSATYRTQEHRRSTDTQTQQSITTQLPTKEPTGITVSINSSINLSPLSTPASPHVAPPPYSMSPTPVALLPLPLVHELGTLCREYVQCIKTQKKDYKQICKNMFGSSMTKRKSLDNNSAQPDHDDSPTQQNNSSVFKGRRGEARRAWIQGKWRNVWGDGIVTCCVRPVVSVMSVGYSVIIDLIQSAWCNIGRLWGRDKVLLRCL